MAEGEGHPSRLFGRQLGRHLVAFRAQHELQRAGTGGADFKAVECRDQVLWSEQGMPPVERPNTVAGLIEKHRTIAGQIDATRKHLDALVFDLEAVEHTIRLFDPDAKLGRAKPLPSPHAAFRGEMRRDVLAALRAATGPLTSLDIAQEVVKVRKVDPALTPIFRKRASAALWKLAQKGIVAEVAQVGDYKGWRISLR